MSNKKKALDIQEIEVEKGIGIWGNKECIQCGACCYEWGLFLYQIEVNKTEQCESFTIRDGKAYCLSHECERAPICKKYFCGNTDFRCRFAEGGDEKLREIARKLGTAPSNYSIPKLLPKFLLNK